jgi:type I restriction enzyme R subunit
LYAFLAQVMLFTDPDLERLYTFARFFETKLPQDSRRTAPPRWRCRVEVLPARQAVGGGDRAARRRARGGIRREGGRHKQAREDEAQLSEIIEVLNERFGTEFDQADQLLFDQFIAAAKLDDEVVQRARANPLDNFALAMKGKVEGLMVDRMEQNQVIVTRYLNDPQFQDLAFRLLVRRIYDEIRARQGESAGRLRSLTAR